MRRFDRLFEFSVEVAYLTSTERVSVGAMMRRLLSRRVWSWGRLDVIIIGGVG